MESVHINFVYGLCNCTFLLHMCFGAFIIEVMAVCIQFILVMLKETLLLQKCAVY